MGILESRLAQRARRSPYVRPPAIAAYRAIDRALPAPAGPKILANSMPKSGTHLLTSLIASLPKMRFAGQSVAYRGQDTPGASEEFKHLVRRLRLLRDSHYIGGHLAFDPNVERVVADSGVRMVTIIRDPRAHVLSWAHYLLTTRHVPGRQWVTDQYPDMESLLPQLVRGIGVPGISPYMPDVGERFRRYSAWNTSNTGIVVRFEDLVGGRGGGDDDRQREVTHSILDYLGYSGSSAVAHDVTERIFSTTSATFRSGQIDTWREELPAELAEETYELCGTLMETWGYER